MRCLRWLPAAAACFCPLLAAPLSTLPGESFTFRVSWGPLDKAGVIQVAAATVADAGKPRTEVVVHTASAGLVRRFCPFDAEARSLFDPDSGRLLSTTATTRTTKKTIRSSLTFDPGAARATYVDLDDPARNRTLSLPDTPPMDLVTMLVEARGWSLSPGDNRDVAVLFDNELYSLTLHALRYERVRTENGSREALLVTPRMDKNPRGLFKRGGEIRVWLDRAAPHLPVRCEVKTKAGTAMALLTSYRSPDAPAEKRDPEA